MTILIITLQLIICYPNMYIFLKKKLLIDIKIIIKYLFWYFIVHMNNEAP